MIYIRWFLLLFCMLSLVSCGAESPSGEIVLTDSVGGGLTLYNFDSQEAHSWETLSYPPSTQGTQAWSPDYRQVVYDCYVEHQSNLCLYNLDLLTTEVLLKNDHSYGEIFWAHATWTLDGKNVTFVTNADMPVQDTNYRQTLYTIDVQTKSVAQLTELPNNLGPVSSLAWVSEDKLLMGLNGRHDFEGHILLWDAQTWEPSKVADGLFPHWSPQLQRIVFMRRFLCFNAEACFVGLPDKDTYWRKISSRVEVYTIDASGENEELIYEAPPNPYVSVRSHGFFWSPDGRYLAYTEGGGEMEKSDLYIMRVADGHIERLVEGLESPALDLSWLRSLDK